MQNVSTALELISALLITGGYEVTGAGTEDDPLKQTIYTTAEVWAPEMNGAEPLHCNIPSMNQARYLHTVLGGDDVAPLVCGGADSYAEAGSRSKTCEQYDGSSWQELDDIQLRMERYGHSAWRDNTTDITYLIGAPWSEDNTGPGVDEWVVDTFSISEPVITMGPALPWGSSVNNLNPRVNTW